MGRYGDQRYLVAMVLVIRKHHLDDVTQSRRPDLTFLAPLNLLSAISTSQTGITLTALVRMSKSVDDSIPPANQWSAGSLSGCGSPKGGLDATLRESVSDGAARGRSNRVMTLEFLPFHSFLEPDRLIY